MIFLYNEMFRRKTPANFRAFTTMKFSNAASIIRTVILHYFWNKSTFFVVSESLLKLKCSLKIIQPKLDDKIIKRSKIK